MRRIWLRRPVLGWALYDWANSAFSLSVVTAFVPVLLAGYWNDGSASPVVTFRLGMANGVGSFAVAVLAPLLGALADTAGRRKQLLATFTLLGVMATAALYAVTAGAWFTAAVLYVLASIGFSAGNSLYDSLLVNVAVPAEYDRVSAYGYGLGYLGSALLFTLNVAMAARPQAFGFPTESAALRVAFLLVAVWWAIFTLPLLAWVPEKRGLSIRARKVWLAGFGQLLGTLRNVRRQRNLFLFLAAYWLYIDGIYTIIKMAVDYGLSLGLSSQSLIKSILLTNFVAFPAAIVFGRLGERIGTRTGIYLGLTVYVLATLGAVFIHTEFEFAMLALVIGLVQGGVQSLSRSFFARLIPAHQTSEYFGFYNMLGKFAAILGPVLSGVVALASGSQRLGILSILILFISGTALLTRVREPGAAGIS
jgi:UMF1 family MFS transporter